MCVSRFGLEVRRQAGWASVRIRFGSPFSSKVVVCGHCLVTLSLTIIETLKWLSSLPILMLESFWCRHCSVWERYLLSPPHGISVSVPASTSPEMTQLVGGRTSVRYRFGSPFSSKILRFVDTLVTVSPTIIETLKWLSSLLIVVQESSWW